MSEGLQVQGLKRPGLGPIDLDIASGECVALMGPSGSGKTLCLRAIADLDPNEGAVRAYGHDRNMLPAPEWRRLVAFVPAESGWWADIVAAHFPEPSAALPLIEAFLLPLDALDWRVDRLSTGERQRLALARSLAGPARVLLLDEPTAALDEAARDAVESVLRERLSTGAAILLVTHDVAQAQRFSARVSQIDAGRIRRP